MSREHEIRFPDRFWRRSTHLSMDAKGLYAVLATFADYKTGETYVSNERLQLETGHCLRKVKTLLAELERAGFIKRWQDVRRNLKSKRHIRCLKYVVPVVQNLHPRPGGAFFGTTEKGPTIFTPVTSSVPQSEQSSESQLSVTREKKESHLYPTQDHSVLEVADPKPERIM